MTTRAALTSRLLPDPIGGFCEHGVMVAVTRSVEFLAEMDDLELRTVSKEDVRGQFDSCDECGDAS